MGSPTAMFVLLGSVVLMAAYFAWANRRNATRLDLRQWWPSIEAELERAMTEAGTNPFARDISERVADIHPKLVWEFCEGTGRPRALALVTEGNAAALRAALVWSRDVRPTGLFEFHVGRQALPANVAADFVLPAWGREVAFSDLSFLVESVAATESLVVTLVHPAFADLDAERAAALAVLLANAALGELVADTWVSLAAPTAKAADTVDLAELRAAVASLKTKATGEVWTEVEAGSTKVRVNGALKHNDNLFHQRHAEITLPASAEQPVFLRQLGGSVLFAQQSLPSQRALDLYVHPDEVAVVEAAVSRLEGAEVVWRSDPEWDAWHDLVHPPA